MNSIMRRTARGAAAGMGALAIIAGTAACGGLLPGGDEGEGETTTEESGESGSEESDGAEEGGDDTATEEDDAAATEEGGDDAATDEGGDDAASEEGAEEGGDDAAAGEALTEEDLTAVGDVFYEFLQAAAAGDGEAACGLITNPNTGEPLTGAEASACATGFEEQVEKQGIDPSIADALDRSMVEGVDNGDGTASVSMMGSDAGVTFVKVDGSWYMEGSQFV